MILMKRLRIITVEYDIVEGKTTRPGTIAFTVSGTGKINYPKFWKMAMPEIINSVNVVNFSVNIKKYSETSAYVPKNEDFLEQSQNTLNGAHHG